MKINRGTTQVKNLSIRPRWILIDDSLAASGVWHPPVDIQKASGLWFEMWPKNADPNWKIASCSYRGYRKYMYIDSIINAYVCVYMYAIRIPSIWKYQIISYHIQNFRHTESLRSSHPTICALERNHHKTAPKPPKTPVPNKVDGGILLRMPGHSKLFL